MDVPDITPRQVATTAAYFLLGVVGTAIAVLGVLLVLQPVQPVLYGAVYLWLGPSEATQFALLAHFVLSGAVAVTVPTLLGEYLSDRGANLRALLVGLGVVAGLLLVLLAVMGAGLAAFPVALLWVLASGVAVPVLLRYRYGVRSGGVSAFVGGIPVLAFVLLLAGIGLGWGWGYVVTAEEVTESGFGDAEVASMETVPQVREDLFTGDCSGDGNGGERCYLELRGYEHELAATRFLDRHGVRCPYRGTGHDPGSVLVRHDGTYYRVSCGSHGD